jgi:LysM repeat protein
MVYHNVEYPDVGERLMKLSVRLIIAASMLAALWVSNVALVSADWPVHVVQSGDILADIAITYDVSLSSLMLANGLTNPNYIWPGQELTIPQASTASASPLGAVYVVQYGDTLSNIARRYGLSASLLAQANGLASIDYIETGQQLVIPGGSSSVVPGSNTTVTHRVQIGEYLASIASLYGTTASALAEANGIGNPWLIYPGQLLTIPTGGSSAAQPSATQTPSPEDASGTTPTPEDASDTTPTPEGSSETTPTPGASSGETPTPEASSNQTPTPVDNLDETPTPAAPSGGSLHFYVVISLQRCYLYRDASLLHDWPCSTGRAGAATIPGEFKVQSKIRNAWGSRFNAWMPYWLGIYWAGSSENGIHALPIDAYSGITWWADQVGTPITFGCIMLDNEAAITLWSLAYVGMPVTIQY